MKSMVESIKNNPRRFLAFCRRKCKSKEICYVLILSLCFFVILMMIIMTVPEVTEQLITRLSTFKFKSNVLKQLDINKGTPPNNLPLLSTYTVVNGVYVDFS